jgi:hypothetical protein
LKLQHKKDPSSLFNETVILVHVVFRWNKKMKHILMKKMRSTSRSRKLKLLCKTLESSPRKTFEAYLPTEREAKVFVDIWNILFG